VNSSPITNAAVRKINRGLLPTLPSSLVNYCSDDQQSNGIGRQMMAKWAVGKNKKQWGLCTLSENGLFISIFPKKVFVNIGGDLYFK